MRAKALGWRTTKREKNTKSEVLGVQEVGDAVNEIITASQRISSK